MELKMELQSISSTTQLQEVLARANNKTVVLDFTAEWCAPCKKIAPVLRELATTFTANFDVFTVDVDAAHQLVTHFKVTTMPTFVFLRNNRVIYVFKGASADLLTQAFEIISSVTQPGV